MLERTCFLGAEKTKDQRTQKTKKPQRANVKEQKRASEPPPAAATERRSLPLWIFLRTRAFAPLDLL
jgi:hypothetical protein